MKTWMLFAAVGLSACSGGGNKAACENIFKVTTGKAASEGGSFLEMCLQNQTVDRLGIYCKNPKELLACAEKAGDKDALGKCKDTCQRKSCTDVTKAVIARAGDKYDDAAQEAMLKRAENDLGCSWQFDAFNFP
jgi:hypothetical protein